MGPDPDRGVARSGGRSERRAGSTTCVDVVMRRRLVEQSREGQKRQESERRQKGGERRASDATSGSESAKARKASAIAQLGATWPLERSGLCLKSCDSAFSTS